MDDILVLAISLILNRMKDKKRFGPYQAALRKIIRSYQLAFPQDEIWTEVCARKEGA